MASDLSPRRLPSAKLICLIAAVLLVAGSLARIVAGYRIFNQTTDEGYHVACGMEWLDLGTYTRETQHPPLARIAVAIGPWLAGARSQSIHDNTDEGNAILYSNGNYWRTLTLARLGTLPFFILACVFVYMWAVRWFSMSTGVWALLMFVSLPPILAHAGVATNDMACAASLCVALYLLMRWLENPGWLQAMALGTGISVAFLSKFSNLVLFPVCSIAAITCFLIAQRGTLGLRREVRVRIGQILLAGVVAFFLTWAGYRFSVMPLKTDPGHFRSLSLAHPGLKPFLSLIGGIPFPLTPMARGFREVLAHNEYGHFGYLFGEYRDTGWWYYFPVALGVKTPVGFLILSMAGLFAVLWRWKSADWQQSATAVFSLLILGVCMFSTINIGVRHILMIYPFLALLAGQAISLSFRDKRMWLAGSVSLLLVCSVLIESWIAHPDYLAYFNPLAGTHPENILSDSNLDWGQDLDRLSRRLKARGVKKVTIGYFGSAPLDKADLPEYTILSPVEKTGGYIAVSLYLLTVPYAAEGDYRWLKIRTPLEKIGKSIYLYNVTD